MEKRLPAMIHMYEKLRHRYPKTADFSVSDLHYQNGGICIGAKRKPRFLASMLPEKTSAAHGKNRLMGNSLLDIVFGRIAGTEAAAYSKTAHPGKGIDHVRRFDRERAAGFTGNILSPKLLPDYPQSGNPGIRL